MRVGGGQQWLVIMPLLPFYKHVSATKSAVRLAASIVGSLLIGNERHPIAFILVIKAFVGDCRKLLGTVVGQTVRQSPPAAPAVAQPARSIRAQSSF
jgi:hypothetical protein